MKVSVDGNVIFLKVTQRLVKKETVDAAMPELNRLYKQFSDRGQEFMFVLDFSDMWGAGIPTIKHFSHRMSELTPISHRYCIARVVVVPNKVVEKIVSSFIWFHGDVNNMKVVDQYDPNNPFVKYTLNRLEAGSLVSGTKRLGLE